MCSTVIDSETASTAELIAAALQIAAELANRKAPESGTDCMDLAEELLTVIDRCEAAVSPLIDRVDESRETRSAGHGSTQAWLRSACGMHGGRARDRVTVARQLPRLNEVTDQFIRGDLRYGYVTVITNAVSRLNDEDTATAERLLLDHVDEGMTVRELAKYATHIHDHLARLNGTEPDARHGYQRSWVKQTGSADGGAFIKGWLSPEDAALLRGCLESLTKPAGADDPRDHAERTADALHTILSGGGRNWGATVIIDHTTLQPDHSQDEQPGDTRLPRDGAWFADGTPIPPERARQIALTAGISALILGPHGLPLYLGRTTRIVTPAQRRALEALYPTCAVNDCDVAATVCEIDHVTPWTNGGVTNIDQLAPLCTFHNRYKAQRPDRIGAHWHNGRWRYAIRHRSTADAPLVTTLKAA